MSDGFPAPIQRFIEHHIESLAQLEALLLLRKEPGRQWNAQEIASALYITSEMVGSLLGDLANRGFVQVISADTPRYSYRTIDAATDQLIDQLQTVYRDRRVAVISLIYSKPLRKVQTFADAFRLRKET